MRAIRVLFILFLAWSAGHPLGTAANGRSAASAPRAVPELPPNYCIWDGLALAGGRDVCIGKRPASTTPFVRGQPAVYSLVVSNTTLLDSNAPITVTDILPQGLQFETISVPSPWRCMNTTAAVRCVRSTPLHSQTQETLTLSATVQMAAPVKITNCATVAMAGDSDPTNNDSCVMSDVIWPHRIFAVPLLRDSVGSPSPPPGTP